jgi:inositol transport system substrate-binding protein
MRKFGLTAIMAMVLMAVILSGCGSSKTDNSAASSPAASGQTQAPEDKKIRIGFSIYGLGAEFANLIVDAMKKEAERQNVELIVLDGQSTVDTQISQLKTLATQKVDAIIVSPIDTNALSDTVDSIADSGIPVIGVNSIMTAKKLTSYIGSPDVQAGEMAAEQVIQAIGGKGNVVIMEGVIGQSSQLQRTEGIMNVLKKYPDVKVLAQKPANWSRAEGLALMENWIQAFPDKIDGVIAENDEMALGAINALQAKQIKIPVVGIDGVKDALTAIENGDMLATFFQNAVAQGERSLQIAIDVVNGKQVEKEYNIPFELITKENVADYKK